MRATERKNKTTWNLLQRHTQSHQTAAVNPARRCPLKVASKHPNPRLDSVRRVDHHSHTGIGNLSESLPRLTTPSPCLCREQDSDSGQTMGSTSLEAESTAQKSAQLKEPSSANYRQESAKMGHRTLKNFKKPPLQSLLLPHGTRDSLEPGKSLQNSEQHPDGTDRPQQHTGETAEAKGFPTPQPRHTSKKLHKSRNAWVVLLCCKERWPRA